MPSLRFDAGNAGMAYNFAERLIAEGMTAGEALADLRRDVDVSNRWWYWKNYLTFNLWGDPSLGLDSHAQVMEPIPVDGGVEPDPDDGGTPSDAADMMTPPVDAGSRDGDMMSSPVDAGLSDVDMAGADVDSATLTDASPLDARADSQEMMSDSGVGDSQSHGGAVDSSAAPGSTSRTSSQGCASMSAWWSLASNSAALSCFSAVRPQSPSNGVPFC